MHNRIGPWHTVTIGTEDNGDRYIALTHPGQTIDDECPKDCTLRLETRSRTVDLIALTDGLPVGEYRLRSQWGGGLLQNLDGSDVVYPDTLADLEPLDLDADVLERLVDIGNAERNRYYHERACNCPQYPHSCASGLAIGVHDTDAYGISIPLILAAAKRLGAA